MKIATARKQPSGNWKILVYSGIVNGKRKYQSFTAPTKREAEYRAAQYLHSVGKATQEDMTVGEAIDRYIESKSNVLSPATVKCYKSIRKHDMTAVEKLTLSRLTQEVVQRWAGELSQDHTPKTVANAHGLLSAVLGKYKPGLELATLLPQAKPKKPFVPTQKQVLALLENSRGTLSELPVHLAAMMGLRRSEICGLTWDDVDMERRQIEIRHAVVVDEDNNSVRKAPKSESGYRTLEIPPAVYEILEARRAEGGPLITFKPPAVTSSFIRLRDRVGVPKMRFHDLRHYYASVMLALGIPDKYAMQRMGHATDKMLKTVYQHLLEEKDRDVSDKIAGYFANMQTEMQTDKKKVP